jgi:hypothetical protein
MAKQTALELVNRILNRIGQSQVSDISALVAGSHADIILNFLNEGQNQLYAEDLEWYSLYRTREFDTVRYTAATISFADTDPDTILDSANGFGSFQAGMYVKVSGSTSNDGYYVVNTAAAGTLTLQTADSLTAEAAGDTVVITAASYPVATDYGRTLDLIDTNNNNVLVEDVTRSFDEYDPDNSRTSTPTHFAIEGSQYRIFPTPAGTYSLRERYYALPSALTANTDTSDLPVEAENALIRFAWWQMLSYLNKFDESDRVRIDYQRALKTAKTANKRKIDKLIQFQGFRDNRSLKAPRLPAAYGSMSWPR